MPATPALRRKKRQDKLRQDYVDPYREGAAPYSAAEQAENAAAIGLTEGIEDEVYDYESAPCDDPDWRVDEGDDEGDDSVVREIQTAMAAQRLEEREQEYGDVTLQNPYTAPAIPSRQTSREDIEHFFVGLQCKRDVPKAVMIDIIEYLRRNAVVICHALESGELASFRAMRDHATKLAPKVRIDVVCTDREGSEVAFSGLTRFPRKEIGERDLRLVYALYYCSLSDIYQWHCKAHPDGIASRIIDMSVDGVPESKSSGLSIDVLCVRFTDCRAIYPLVILQPWKKKLGGKDALTLKPLLQELEQSGLSVRRIIADAPKRAPLQGLKSHAATSGCPYCVAKKVNGKYPSGTFGGHLRTDHELRRQGEEVERGEANAYGVKGKGLAADIPRLDLTRDIPAESMHLVFLGVVRKMLKLMYLPKPGQTRYEVRHMPADDSHLNALLRYQKGLTNFSRCTRDFDRANYKSEEYRNLVWVYWPLVMETAPPGTAKVWLLTVYIVRAISLPDSLYIGVKDKVKELIGQWYVEYERAFKAENCTYNTHVFSHVDLVRELGPLWETSATAFEDFYAILKRNYREGTTATGSQALLNSLLALMSGHHCVRPRIVTITSTSRLEDRFIYTRDGRIMKLTHLGDNELRGVAVPMLRVTGLVRGLDFSDVLVYRVDGNGHTESTIQPSDVIGKVVVSGAYASVVLWPMFSI